MDKKTSTEAAKELGISRSSLHVYLNRHPHLKPVEMVQAGKFVIFQWTDAEIEAVRKSKAATGPGRPKKIKEENL